MKSGLHAPNMALSVSRSSTEAELLDLARPQVVKLLWTPGCQHKPTDAGRLCAWGVGSVILRIGEWMPGDQLKSKAAEVAVVINEFYLAGVKIFQLFNEPNWLWTKKPMGPWQYQFYLRLLIKDIRALIPADVELISPPLSFAPGLWHHDPPGTPPEKRQNPTDFILDDWLQAFAYKGDQGELQSVYELFDYLGSNCYWQSAHQLVNPSFGRCYLRLKQDAGAKGIWVLEYGASYHQLQMPPAQVEQRRVQEYPQWLGRAAMEGVLGACLFIWGGTPDWVGYRLTPAVASAIALQ
jgi:hypothetical protein